jgi:hypothetical protein
VVKEKRKYSLNNTEKGAEKFQLMTLRCCPFAPKIIAEEDEERENKVVEIIEEKQFKRKGSA